MKLSEWYETGDRFQWRGQEVFYQEAGEGEAIFLLHGFLISSWIYKEIWQELSQHYRVIAPDYIGFGYSSKPTDYEYSFDERTDLVYALADLLDIKKIKVITCSFSNSVAQELMLRTREGRSPIDIESIALLNGAIYHDIATDPIPLKIMLNPLVSWISWFFGRRTLKYVLNSLTGRYSKIPDKYLDELFEINRYNKGLKNLIELSRYVLERGKRSKEWMDALFKTDIPVQLIWGIDSEDRISGLHMVHEYRKLRGDQYVVMIKDIGHLPQVECPELVVDYYTSFLDGLKGKAETVESAKATS